LYVSLGMGSASRNQPATVSGLGYLVPLKFQEWLLRIFEYLHSPNGLILLMYIYLQCSTINLCFKAWRKCSSNIIYLCNGHVMRDKKNTHVHGIMQRAVPRITFSLIISLENN